MKGQAGFFDLDERYAALSEVGDLLVRLVTVSKHPAWAAENAILAQ